MFQERVLGQGPQNNESAIEQAKDEQISGKLFVRHQAVGCRLLTLRMSDFIRGKYKSTTGSDLPIEDKQTRLG